MSLPSEDYTTWHTDASWQLKKYLSSLRLYPRNKITCTFYAGDKRKWDLSNKFESIADLLVDNGFLTDDNYTVIPEVVLIFGGINAKNPSVNILIEEIK